jgi:hypothetical protein
MKRYEKIVNKPPNAFIVNCCVHFTVTVIKCVWEILYVTCYLYFCTYFSVLCNVLYCSSSSAYVAGFHTNPSTKKCNFFKVLIFSSKYT